MFSKEKIDKLLPLCWVVVGQDKHNRYCVISVLAHSDSEAKTYVEMAIAEHDLGEFAFEEIEEAEAMVDELYNELCFEIWQCCLYTMQYNRTKWRMFEIESMSAPKPKHRPIVVKGRVIYHDHTSLDFATVSDCETISQAVDDFYRLGRDVVNVTDKEVERVIDEFAFIAKPDDILYRGFEISDIWQGMLSAIKSQSPAYAWFQDTRTFDSGITMSLNSDMA